MLSSGTGAAAPPAIAMLSTSGRLAPAGALRGRAQQGLRTRCCAIAQDDVASAKVATVSVSPQDKLVLTSAPHATNVNGHSARGSCSSTPAEERSSSQSVPGNSSPSTLQRERQRRLFSKRAQASNLTAGQTSQVTQAELSADCNGARNGVQERQGGAGQSATDGTEHRDRGQLIDSPASTSASSAASATVRQRDNAQRRRDRLKDSADEAGARGQKAKQRHRLGDSRDPHAAPSAAEARAAWTSGADSGSRQASHLHAVAARRQQLDGTVPQGGSPGRRSVQASESSSSSTRAPLAASSSWHGEEADAFDDEVHADDLVLLPPPPRPHRLVLQRTLTPQRPLLLRASVSAQPGSDVSQSSSSSSNSSSSIGANSSAGGPRKRPPPVLLPNGLSPPLPSSPAADRSRPQPPSTPAMDSLQRRGAGADAPQSNQPQAQAPTAPAGAGRSGAWRAAAAPAAAGHRPTARAAPAVDAYMSPAGAGRQASSPRLLQPRVARRLGYMYDPSTQQQPPQQQQQPQQHKRQRVKWRSRRYQSVNPGAQPQLRVSRRLRIYEMPSRRFFKPTISQTSETPIPRSVPTPTAPLPVAPAAAPASAAAAAAARAAAASPPALQRQAALQQQERQTCTYTLYCPADTGAQFVHYSIDGHQWRSVAALKMRAPGSTTDYIYVATVTVPYMPQPPSGSSASSMGRVSGSGASSGRDAAGPSGHDASSSSGVASNQQQRQRRIFGPPRLMFQLRFDALDGILQLPEPPAGYTTHVADTPGTYYVDGDVCSPLLQQPFNLVIDASSLLAASSAASPASAAAAAAAAVSPSAAAGAGAARQRPHSAGLLQAPPPTLRSVWRSSGALGRTGMVIVNTSRSLQGWKQAWAEVQASAPDPDVLILGLGTQVLHRTPAASAAAYQQRSMAQGQTLAQAQAQAQMQGWQEDETWRRQLDWNWDVAAVRAAADAIIQQHTADASVMADTVSAADASTSDAAPADGSASASAGQSPSASSSTTSASSNSSSRPSVGYSLEHHQGPHRVSLVVRQHLVASIMDQLHELLSNPAFASHDAPHAPSSEAAQQQQQQQQQQKRRGALQGDASPPPASASTGAGAGAGAPRQGGQASPLTAPPMPTRPQDKQPAARSLEPLPPRDLHAAAQAQQQQQQRRWRRAVKYQVVLQPRGAPAPNGMPRWLSLDIIPVCAGKVFALEHVLTVAAARPAAPLSPAAAAILAEAAGGGSSRKGASSSSSQSSSLSPTPRADGRGASAMRGGNHHQQPARSQPRSVLGQHDRRSLQQQQQQQQQQQPPQQPPQLPVLAVGDTERDLPLLQHSAFGIITNQRPSPDCEQSSGSVPGGAGGAGRTPRVVDACSGSAGLLKALRRLGLL